MLLVLFAIPSVIGILYGLNMKELYQRNKYFFISFFIALTIITIIGSKVGSGTNHLIPFIPIFFYILLLVLSSIKQKNSNLWDIKLSGVTGKASYLVLIFILITAVTLSGIKGERRVLEPMLNIGDRTEIFQEIQILQSTYKGKTIAIGHGGNQEAFNKYRDFTPLPVFAGNPYLIDKVAFEDRMNAGLKIPPATIKKLAEGEVQVWLIKTGELPFNLKCFDEVFRQTFLNNYKLVAKHAFFDVWVHKTK